MGDVLVAQNKAMLSSFMNISLYICKGFFFKSIFMKPGLRIHPFPVIWIGITTVSMLKILFTVLPPEDGRNATTFFIDTLSPEVIDERLRELQKALVKKANQKADYDAIADEILRLRDMRKQAEVDSVVKDEQMHLIQDLQDFIKSQPSTITEFDEILVKRLITKITVFEDHFTVEFKSGVTIDIEA